MISSLNGIFPPEEEVDDLADQLRSASRQSALKQRNDKTIEIEGRAAEFLQQKFFQEHETKFSNKIQPSISCVDFRFGLPVSSGKVEETTSYREVKGVDLAVVNTPTEQKVSPSNIANQVPMSSLQKHHPEADGVVLSSGKLLGAHYSSAVPVEQCGTLVNILTPTTRI